MKKIYALVLVVFACSACKKEKTTPSSNNVNMSPYSSSTAGIYSGAFVAGNYTINSTNSGTTFESNAKVSFHAEPKEYKEIDAGIPVGSIRLKGRNVPFRESEGYYELNDWDINSEQVWQVEGMGLIPSFNFKINNPTPTASDLNVIPDSVSISKGFSIQVPGVKNVTPGARVIVYDVNYKEICSKPLVNGDNTVSFTSSDFTSSAEAGAILVELENGGAYNIYGKDFLFIKARGWMKQVKFNP